jgi:hypothetical protein
MELAYKALSLDVTWELVMAVVGSQGPVYSSSFVLVWCLRFCKTDVRLFADFC